jgi:hypothetical protein
VAHPDTAPAAHVLADLKPPAPVTDPAFALAREVYQDARAMYLETWLDDDGVPRRHCPRCDRGIIDLRYTYTPDEAAGLIVAHMIQTHGWTRESTGD